MAISDWDVFNLMMLGAVVMGVSRKCQVKSRQTGDQPNPQGQHRHQHRTHGARADDWAMSSARAHQRGGRIERIAVSLARHPMSVKAVKVGQGAIYVRDEAELGASEQLEQFVPIVLCNGTDRLSRDHSISAVPPQPLPMHLAKGLEQSTTDPLAGQLVSMP